MNTTENNQLIAEFMNVDQVDIDQAYEDYGELRYHTSWDWLMPVVEKIEVLGYTLEKNYQRIDKDWQCLIIKGNDILFQEFNEDSRLSTHYVVVEFIKWYNERYICGCCGENCNEYTYNEEKDIDECNKCK
jgi:hypothetical protein